MVLIFVNCFFFLWNTICFIFAVHFPDPSSLRFYSKRGKGKAPEEGIRKNEILHLSGPTPESACDVKSHGEEEKKKIYRNWALWESALSKLGENHCERGLFYLASFLRAHTHVAIRCGAARSKSCLPYSRSFPRPRAFAAYANSDANRARTFSFTARICTHTHTHNMRSFSQLKFEIAISISSRYRAEEAEVPSEIRGSDCAD